MECISNCLANANKFDQQWLTFSLCYIVIISYWLRAQMRLFGKVQLFGLKAPEMQLQWRCNCWAGELEAEGGAAAWWACCTKSTKLKGFESRAVRPLLNHARSSGSLCAFHTTFGDHCALLKRVFGGACPFKHQNLREVTAQKCQNCRNFWLKSLLIYSLSPNIFVLGVKLFSDHFLFTRGSISKLEVSIKTEGCGH